MNEILQTHEGKHIYKVPEGLRELCTDISREVLRSQPANLYSFIAEYVDTLLITRENTKIAVKVVNNILLGSQAILSILYRAGFSLEQIAVAAPRIQKAFREFLDEVDTKPTQICGDYNLDEKSLVSIRSILEATGSTREDAERAATVIQAAFRGHYERMALNEAQGKVQWQRAVTNTLDILKKAGASQTEISKAVGHLKFAYRGYYARRNQRLDAPGTEPEPLKKDERILEPAEAIQAVAWMEMMYEDSGLTVEKANEAACVIQRAYKCYRARRRCYDVQKVESTKSLIVEAILDSLRHMVFEKVISRRDIPPYGSREELMTASTRVELTFKEHLRKTRLSKESYLTSGEMEGEEIIGEEEELLEYEELEEVMRHPMGPETGSEADYGEEQLDKKDEMDEQKMSEAEVTEPSPESPEGLETEQEEAEPEEKAEEVQETKETEEQEVQEEKAEVQEVQEEKAEVQEVQEEKTEEVQEEKTEVQEVQEEKTEVQEVQEEKTEVQEVQEEKTEVQEVQEEKTEVQEEKTEVQEVQEEKTEVQEVQKEEPVATEAKEEEPNVAQETDGAAATAEE